MQTLSERLVTLRTKRGIPQAEVAKAVGVSRVAVTKWESGQTENIKLANLLALCKLYNLSADELITGAPSKSGNQPYPSHTPAPAQIARESSSAFPAELERQFARLTPQGREMVVTQLEVAIETARRLHGDASRQTAA